MDAPTQHLIDGLVALIIGLLNFWLTHRKTGNLQTQIDVLTEALVDCLDKKSTE